MRLVVEEAQDHSACMEKLRSLYGADCVVVHSFRVDDRYRVVVALETEIRSRELPQENIVKDVVSNRQIRWDTLIDDDMAALDEPLSSDHPDGNDTGRHGTSPQPLPEISSGLLELAARIKALEAFEPPAILEPESNDFRAAVFSDVLAAAVATGSDTRKAITYSGNSVSETMGNIRETSAPVARVTSFPPPVELLVNSCEDAPLQANSNEATPEEASIPRVCTSDSAENFASLLLSCVADSRKTLPLSEPSQLRMVAS
jgi:hypothetical protein